MTERLHLSHPDLIKRLKRAHGHLFNVIGMLEQGRECADIAQQLHAVEKSVSAAKKLLIHDHLDHCLEHAVQGTPRQARNALAGFKDITKYL
jgi:hypothetical protein NreA